MTKKYLDKDALNPEGDKDKGESIDSFNAMMGKIYENPEFVPGEDDVGFYEKAASDFLKPKKSVKSEPKTVVSAMPMAMALLSIIDHAQATGGDMVLTYFSKSHGEQRYFVGLVPSEAKPLWTIDLTVARRFTDINGHTMISVLRTLGYKGMSLMAGA